MDCPLAIGWCRPPHQQLGVAATTPTSISERTRVPLLLVASRTLWGGLLLMSSP